MLSVYCYSTLISRFNMQIILRVILHMKADELYRYIYVRLSIVISLRNLFIYIIPLKQKTVYTFTTCLIIGIFFQKEEPTPKAKTPGKPETRKVHKRHQTQNTRIDTYIRIYSRAIYFEYLHRLLYIHSTFSILRKESTKYYNLKAIILLRFRRKLSLKRRRRRYTKQLFCYSHT